MKKSNLTFKISHTSKLHCKNKYLIYLHLDKYGHLGRILSITNKTLRAAYEIAYDLLKQSKYSDAANAFLFLATISSKTIEFWIGLGIASQYLQDFETAITAYEIAAACQIDNPLPYLYLAKAFFALHQREHAFEAIQLAIMHASHKPAYQDLLMQAQKAKELLENNL